MSNKSNANLDMNVAYMTIMTYLTFSTKPAVSFQLYLLPK